MSADGFAVLDHTHNIEQHTASVLALCVATLPFPSWRSLEIYWKLFVWEGALGMAGFLGFSIVLCHCGVWGKVMHATGERTG